MWHKRFGQVAVARTPLPTHWTAEEVRFFRNWSKELAGLHDVLTNTAVDHLKLLRRASKVYFKLAHKLIEEIRRAEARW